MTRPYRLLEHTGDLRFDVEAGDWPGLVAAASRALGDCILAEDQSPADDEFPVTVAGRDREDVLVAWLSAALLAYEREGLVPRGARLARTSETEASGTLLVRRTQPRREPPDRVFKAITYHDLEIVPGRDGRPWRATIVADL
jgi:SHS2 domain-containing protein